MYQNGMVRETRSDFPLNKPLCFLMNGPQQDPPRVIAPSSSASFLSSVGAHDGTHSGFARPHRKKKASISILPAHCQPSFPKNFPEYE
jgi:hypothetical protein